MAEDASDSGDKPKPAKPANPMLESMGRRIRAVRESKGRGLIEAAKAAGIGKGFLWRIEAGQQNVSMTTLARIAVALDTTLANLVEGVEARDGSGPDAEGEVRAKRRPT